MQPIDIHDINHWSKLNKDLYFELFSDPKKNNHKIKHETLKCEVPRLYALLKRFLPEPKYGLFTLQLLEGKPQDNFFWWDFLMGCNEGVIHIFRTYTTLEARYIYTGPDFKLKRFIGQNLKKYKEEIDQELATYEKHSIYINHYKSYKQCVQYLWDEIQNIVLDSSMIPNGTIIEEGIDLEKEFGIYIKACVKFHTLGKSMILNAAFMVENFITLLIRVGIQPVFREYPNAINKFLNYSFSERLEFLTLYTIIFTKELDLEDSAIKNAKELMTLRNKYVHGDESSIHNKIGITYYDNDFPLSDIGDKNAMIIEIEKTFLNPSETIIENSFNWAFKFIDYIVDHLNPEYKDNILDLIERNPIGFNEQKKIYSGISQNTVMGAFFSKESKKGR